MYNPDDVRVRQFDRLVERWALTSWYSTSFRGRSSLSLSGQGQLPRPEGAAGNNWAGVWPARPGQPTGKIIVNITVVVANRQKTVVKVAKVGATEMVTFLFAT